jgi:hypothetical protein
MIELRSVSLPAFDIQQDDLKAAIPQLNVENNIIIKKPIEIGDLAKVVIAQIEKV